MLTPSTRLRLQNIVHRIGADEAVSLEERIYLQKFADRHHAVAAWLKSLSYSAETNPSTSLPAWDVSWLNLLHLPAGCPAPGFFSSGLGASAPAGAGAAAGAGGAMGTGGPAGANHFPTGT